MISITGGTGFIGSHLVRAALQGGRRVRVVARNPQGARELTRAGAEFVAADIQDVSSLERAFAGAEAVIHLVGIIQEKGRSTFEAIHHRGAANAVAAAATAGVTRFVHMSAIGARPNARSRYHRSKWLGEEAVRQSALEWTIHRPSIVYGKGDAFVSRFRAMSRVSPVVPVPGDGTNRLQPVWVGDVVACFLQSLDRAATVRRTYELGGPRPYTLDELIDLILRAAGRRRFKIHLPISFLRMNAAVLERILPNPPVTRDQLLMLQEDNVCDTAAMRAAFDVEMVDLPDGLARLLGSRPSSTRGAKV
jgi:uncharacterized protein YbjT (DUF2867 family)